MDSEQQTSPLLAPTPETLASVKVFPLIPALKRDVLVSPITVTFTTALTAGHLISRIQLVCPGSRYGVKLLTPFRQHVELGVGCLFFRLAYLYSPSHKAVDRRRY